MQIFRPYVNHRKSAAVLDNKRLGKQRVEAKQVIIAILRKLGIVQDGKRGWLNHPIVLLYYNGGRPYMSDLVAYFHAVVAEWRARGYANNISLDDIAHLVRNVGVGGTPITHTHELEYRRLLILKEPCFYLKKFPPEEVQEVLETEPVPIPGVNLWLFDVMNEYREFVRKARRGDVDCAPLFPRR